MQKYVSNSINQIVYFIIFFIRIALSKKKVFAIFCSLFWALFSPSCLLDSFIAHYTLNWWRTSANIPGGAHLYLSMTIFFFVHKWHWFPFTFFFILRGMFFKKFCIAFTAVCGTGERDQKLYLFVKLCCFYCFHSLLSTLPALPVKPALSAVTATTHVSTSPLVTATENTDNSRWALMSLVWVNGMGQWQWSIAWVDAYAFNFQ